MDVALLRANEEAGMNGSEHAAVLAPDELVLAVTAGSTVRRLLQLDAYWTEEARRGTEQTTRDSTRVASLGRVVDEMRSLLAEAARVAPDVAALVETHAGEIRARFDAATDPAALSTGGRTSLLLTAQDQQALRTYVERRGEGDVVTLLRRSADTLRDNAESERRQLEEEYDRLRGGGGSAGDLSEETHHAVLAIEAGLVLAGAPEGAILVEAAVAIAECLGL